MKNAVCSAVKQGFCKSKLTIEEARDILIEWDELGKFSNAKVDDLFLKGGIDDETDFSCSSEDTEFIDLIKRNFLQVEQSANTR